MRKGVFEKAGIGYMFPKNVAFFNKPSKFLKQMFNVSTFSAIAALSFLFNVVVVGASHVLHDISGFICHCLMTVVQVDVITNSHHWSPTTVGGFLLAHCLPIVDTQVTLKLSIWNLVTLNISCPLPFFLLVWEKAQHQRSLRRQFKFHSKWLRNHSLFGSAEYEQTRKEHRRHKSYAKKSLKSVEKELKLAQLVELLSGYERLVHEIKVAELLARYENLVTPLYSLLVFCCFMIGGLLDLVKYAYCSWLQVPSTSLSVNHKFHLSVIVPNGSIIIVLVSNDSTVLEAKQAATLAVGLSVVGLQLYRPGRCWKRLPSSRLLHDLGLNPSTLVQLGPRLQSQSRSQSRNTKSSVLPTTFSQLDPVLTNPVIDQNTVSPILRLSQTRTKSDPTKATAKNVVCHHTGIWFADINPQVSSSWSIPVATTHTVGVASSSNSLPGGKHTHSHLNLKYQPSLPTLSKSPKPTIRHPPFPPITLLDFIPPPIVAQLGLSKVAELIDPTLTQVITVPQGDSPLPEPPPLLEPATVLNTQVAGYSLDSMSYQDWIPSPELALAVFGFLDSVSCVSQKRAIMSALFKSWSQLDKCPPSIAQIESLDLSTTTVGPEQALLSRFFVELVDGHHLFVEMPSMLTIRDLREFLYQERNVIYALSCTLVFGMVKLEDSSLLSSYNIPTDSTLKFVVQVRGGADRASRTQRSDTKEFLTSSGSSPPSQNNAKPTTEPSSLSTTSTVEPSTLYTTSSVEQSTRSAQSDPPPPIPLRDESHETPSLGGSSVDGSSNPGVSPYSHQSRRLFRYSRESSTSVSDLGVDDTSVTTSNIEESTGSTPTNLEVQEQDPISETRGFTFSPFLEPKTPVVAASSAALTASSAVSPTLSFVRSDSNLFDALTAPEPSLFDPHTVSDSEADSVSSQSVQSDFDSVADGEDGDIDYELLNQFQGLGFDDSASDLDWTLLVDWKIY
ncbi:hypothetical protein BCR33DRAFT_717994 [Rhizoclosmatium globosum]|uniref:Ubiquitin-like domain-containing protein n=1 Tax=Rhizoclosmatium globosum TaxID=329046 RepID=A0A1Y2C7B6_9FUNG|nr:hypothetical protein BCR33DRAFT_717994 [Rhizoclosmatium globosum]|eukprot:ORY42787.1 hypothetical protein BCR33DRAFT_717994 [Rhizoclosmatium globosum]